MMERQKMGRYACDSRIRCKGVCSNLVIHKQDQWFEERERER